MRYSNLTTKFINKYVLLTFISIPPFIHSYFIIVVITKFLNSSMRFTRTTHTIKHSYFNIRSWESHWWIILYSFNLVIAPNINISRNRVQITSSSRQFHSLPVCFRISLHFLFANFELSAFNSSILFPHILVSCFRTTKFAMCCFTRVFFNGAEGHLLTETKKYLPMGVASFVSLFQLPFRVDEHIIYSRHPMWVSRDS